MRCFSRMLALPLFLLILIMTPVAFWVFNLERVALDPQTYKTAMQTQNMYNDLLPALVDGIVASSKTDPNVRVALKSLLDKMTVDEWTTASDRILPPAWLRSQLEFNINQLFTWLNGTRQTPGISFDFTELKTRLTGDNAQATAALLVPKLPPCTGGQAAALRSASPEAGLDALPLCNPESADARQMLVGKVAAALNSAGSQLPARWDLSEQLRKMDVTPAADRGTSTGAVPPPHPITEFDLDQFRAFVWLQSRLTVLLFLIPLALFFLIVIINIRSGKQFFRWIGWALLLSGLLTLVPVPFMPTFALHTYAGARMNMEAGFGENGRLLGSLVGGMVSSISSAMTIAVLIQVAIVIGIGFIALVIAVLLPQSAPEVTWHDVKREEKLLARQQISQPTSAPISPVPPVTPPSVPAAGPTWEQTGDELSEWGRQWAQWGHQTGQQLLHKLATTFPPPGTDKDSATPQATRPPTDSPTITDPAAPPARPNLTDDPLADLFQDDDPPLTPSNQE